MFLVKRPFCTVRHFTLYTPGALELRMEPLCRARESSKHMVPQIRARNQEVFAVGKATERVAFNPRGCTVVRKRSKLTAHLRLERRKQRKINNIRADSAMTVIFVGEEGPL